MTKKLVVATVLMIVPAVALAATGQGEGLCATICALLGLGCC